jgi:hypothetical protein
MTAHSRCRFTRCDKSLKRFIRERRTKTSTSGNVPRIESPQADVLAHTAPFDATEVWPGQPEDDL